MRAVIFIFFLCGIFASCKTTKIYRLDNKIKPYVGNNAAMPDLDWKNFDSLLVNTYLPIDWKKNKYQAYKNVIVLRCSKRNIRKFEYFFCNYWSSIYSDNLIKDKFSFCISCLE